MRGDIYPLTPTLSLRERGLGMAVIPGVRIRSLLRLI